MTNTVYQYYAGYWMETGETNSKGQRMGVKFNVDTWSPTGQRIIAIAGRMYETPIGEYPGGTYEEMKKADEELWSRTDPATELTQLRHGIDY